MIEKNEENTESDNNIDRIRLIADKRTVLKKQFLQVQKDIKICFTQLAQTLYAREKQLLRQSEAIYWQQISLALSSQEILPPSVAVLEEKDALEEQIKHFGRLELRGSNSTAITNLEPYKIEDYQDISKDHVSFYKSLKNTGIVPSNAETELSSTTENKNIQNTSCGLRTTSVTNLIGNSSQIFNFQDENSEENSEENLDCSSKMDIELQRNAFNIQVVDTDQQENGGSCKNSGRNITEEQHNSCGHTEQVQQWLDQILLETEIEPTIHEVEKLPEISDAYICTKLQLET